MKKPMSSCCSTPDCCPSPSDAAINAPPLLEAREVEVRAYGRPLVRDASFSVHKGKVFGLIGPSGAGKSTLLRSLNRLTDLFPGLTVSGDVILQGKSIYAPGTDANAVRAQVGMLFQQPVVFPTSIAENVLFGARRLRNLSRSERANLVEEALGEAAIWSEVKDRLKHPATKLSVGQQQRLCLARALATKPEILLMDEPTSALDPKSTEAIEELIIHLKKTHTIVLVTHNLRQARLLADNLAFIGVREGAGQVLCCGSASDVLGNTTVSEVAEFLCCQ